VLHPQVITPNTHALNCYLPYCRALLLLHFVFVHAFCLGIGLAPSIPIPEDLWHLVKKAVAVRKHLEVNRKDKDSKFRLILIESRIHRLARYYKTKQQIPPTFKYDSATASTLIA
jgi:ribosomal protein S15P/S13E